jgi:hypothetical protein
MLVHEQAHSFRPLLAQPGIDRVLSSCIRMALDFQIDIAVVVLQELSALNFTESSDKTME